VLWLPSTRLLTEIGRIYTKISTSHVLPVSWPQKRATNQSTICYSEEVKLSDQLPFSMLSAVPLYTRNSKDRTCENSIFLLQRGKFCEWMDNWWGQPAGCSGCRRVLRWGVPHWAANRWLETIVLYEQVVGG